MKNFMINFIVFFLISLASMKIYSQEIKIDSIFSSSFELFPFGQIENISGITVDGDVHLNSDTSLVRVIMKDDYGFQYMIFETYPLICPNLYLNLHGYCDETCLQEQVNPNSIIIQVIDATLNLKSFYYTTDPKENASEERYKAKRALDAEKIETMNQLIPFYEMKWTAGDNEIVASYYDQKRIMFGDGYNLRGYDYYAGGVFEFLGHRSYPKVDPEMVWEFDWRNRHGVNDSLSPYWNGDLDKAGWLTGAKKQGPVCANSCWAFAATGVTEAIANLYSASHINYNLSEQDLLSCSYAGDCTDGGHVDSALRYIKNYGVVTKNCFPYHDSDYYKLPCTSNLKCQNPNPIIKIFDTLYFNTANEKNFDSIRRELITRGPVNISFSTSGPLAHAVVLSGFKFNIEDSTLTWIIKDSHGNGGLEKGFREIQLEYLMDANAVIPPIFHNDTALEVKCHDYDHDGYCFWGIGPKPASCDSCNCKEEEDCDDNDSLVGGYDENYNCRCLLEYDSIPQYITADTIWEDTVYVDRTVIVDSGACLTIKSITLFDSQVKILVYRGGKLILDGGKLTNACPETLWGGIIVYGRDTSQYSNQYFGIVNIINDGIIENARIGISTNYCPLCMKPQSSGGGIIRAEKAIFRNNGIAIEFTPFRNIYQGFERPYMASFKNCLFEYDEYLQDYSDFRYFIKFNQISGIRIQGCDFICDTLSIHPYKEETLKYRSGIYAVGSQFYVEDACLSQSVPCTQHKTSQFHGLNYGIYALGIDGRKTISVKKTFFDQNKTGIYLSAINYATIVRDTFNVNNTFNQKDTLCGLYLNYCTGYQVEENKFYGNVNPYNPWQGSIKKIGLAINNSGILYNEIYNNSFDSLLVGVLALDKNRSNDGRNGLQIICNDFTYCRNDISVDKINRSAKLMGIREYQGNDGTEATSPANNTFSWVNMDFSDYFNNCENILYWHIDTAQTFAHVKPHRYSSSLNPLQDPYYYGSYDKDECCPSHIDTIGGGSLEREKSLILNADQQIDSIQSILNMLVDGGSTEELISEIQNSFPEDAIFLYSDLLNNSPYLSDTSMVVAINREDVLSSTLITDILSENPQSAKSDTVQLALEERSNPLSEEQRSEIDQGWFVISAKESLESRLSGAYAVRNRASNNLIRYFKNDTLITSSVDSVINLYSNESNLELQYLLVSEYLGKGDSTLARNTLENITGSFILNPFQNIQHQNYESYINFLITKISHNNSVFDSDSLDKVQLKSLMNSAEGMLRMLLQNLLEVIDTINYKEPYLLPEYELKTSGIRSNPIKQSFGPSYFRVYPNPTSNYCSIEYSLKIAGSNALIQIIDIHGSVIKQIEVYRNNDLLLVDLIDLPNGIYLFQLIENNKKMEIQKMIKN